MKTIAEKDLFYSTYAMLMASRYYLSHLIESKQVHFTLKREFKILVNRINDLDAMTSRSVGSEADNQEWKRQWTEKDYMVFASVFELMNDMSEEQRAAVEEVCQQIKLGNVRVELETSDHAN